MYVRLCVCVYIFEIRFLSSIILLEIYKISLKCVFDYLVHLIRATFIRDIKECKVLFTRAVIYTKGIWRVRGRICTLYRTTYV